MVAHLAYLDEIFPTRRYLLCPAHSSAIAVDCIDRCSSKPQPWRALRRLRAIEVTSRRGGQPSGVLGSTLIHPQPVPHP